MPYKNYEDRLACFRRWYDRHKHEERVKDMIQAPRSIRRAKRKKATLYDLNNMKKWKQILEKSG